MSKEHGSGENSFGYEERLSRRRMLRALSAAGVIGMAGCQGDEGDQTSTPADDDTPTDADGGGGDGGGGDTETPTETETDTPTGPPLRENLRLRVNTLPQELNFNPWSNATTFGGVYQWLRDMDNVRDLANNFLLSGHRQEAEYRKSGHREWEVPTLVKNRELVETTENYNKIVYEINEDAGFTYWDGTPITASAWEKHLRLGGHTGGDVWTDDYNFSWGREDNPGELHYFWGGEPGVDAETPPTGNPPFNIMGWHSAPPPESPPLHPDFTGEWLSRFEDLVEDGDQEAHEEAVSELTNTALTLDQMVENQWGQGPYRIESTDDFSEESIQFTLRDDHPRSDIITVPQLELKTARQDRYRQLLRQGEIDLAPGLVQPDSPPLDSNVLPDHFQQIDTWAAGGTTMLYFRWNNEHIGRLGVRRAIAAAVPWPQVLENGWGEGGALPMEYDSGMDTPNNSQWLEQDFLDKLHKYPRESDTEFAAEQLRKEGYEKDGDVWKYEDGTPLELLFLNNNDIAPWLGAAQTIQSALQSFGMRVQLDNVAGPAYQDRAENHQFDFMMAGHPASSPSSWFGAHDGALVSVLYAGENEPDEGSDSTFFRCDPDEETDNEGTPTEVTVPKEVGALEIQNGGETYNMCDLAYGFYQYDTTREDLIEIVKKGARFYNYALPNFHFMNLQAGLAGNVRDFDWPQEGESVLNTSSIGTDHYQINAGVPRATRDDSF